MFLLPSGFKAPVARGPVPRDRQCPGCIETGRSLLRYCIETRMSLLPRGFKAPVARGPVPRERECLSYPRHFVKTE